MKLRTLAPRDDYVHAEIICSDDVQHVHDKQPNIWNLTQTAYN